MDTDINDIWDLPVETSIHHLPVDTPDGNGPGSTPPTRASNRPLFLPSDEEEDATATSAGAPTAAEPQRPENTDIDALFEGLDDMDDSFQELAPALDLDALRREADARNARAVRAEMAAMIPAAAAATPKATGGKKGGALDGIDGEGGDADDDEGKKKRKPIPRLDEARLLGQNGLPQLMKDTKNFKPRGKGHEATDLDRLLQVYQFWTHKLYPKTRFKETVDRVEKLCHSKRMQVALSVWRDEAHGLVNGVRLPPEDNNSSSDADSDGDGAPRGGDAAASAVAPAADQVGASSRQPSAPARSRLRRGGVSATSDSEGDSSDSMPPSSDASHPPPPSSPDRDRDRDEAAVELDALLEEEEALCASVRTAAVAAPTAHAWKASSGDAVAMDEDEDLWDMLDTGAGAPTSGTGTAPRAPPAPAMDDDEEMWDIVNEIEQEKAKEATRPPNQVHQAQPAAADAQVDYLEDLYL